MQTEEQLFVMSMGWELFNKVVWITHLVTVLFTLETKVILQPYLTLNQVSVHQLQILTPLDPRLGITGVDNGLLADKYKK